jgi:enamine deaminase RidA (YjgF/YER057c/UK114 family)
MMNKNRPINPPELGKPIGYSNGYVTEGGRTVYLAGQVAFNSESTILYPGDLVKQFGQTIDNLQKVVRAAGGELSDFVKMTIFVKSKSDYKAHLLEIGAIYREYFVRHFPAMSLVEVRDLFEDDALIEIEAVAVISTQE